MVPPAERASAGPRISVVTPFYNGVQYLRQCVESVLAQTHRNFEYVLVDNFSKDGASELAQSLAESDPRIRLVRPSSFLPQVENYNFALSQVAPDAAYVKVVAADDWIFPRCLAEMVAVAEKHPSAAIVSSYRLRGTEVAGVGLEPGRSLITGREACRLHLLNGIFLFGSPTSLLFRADLLQQRQPFYATGRLHEDTEAVFEILRDRDFGFAHEILTFSRMQAESEMGARRGFGPEALDRFIIVSRFGPEYLDPAELRQCLGHAKRWHYSVLAEGWVADRLGKAPDGFWEYQRRGLESVGQVVDPKELALAVARFASRRALSPLMKARDVWTGLRQHMAERSRA
jgi:glycosyltransferase involved in cell wall biosynthesis